MQGLRTNAAMSWDRKPFQSIQFEIDGSGRVIQNPEHKVIAMFCGDNGYMRAKIEMLLSLNYPEGVPEGRDVFTIRLNLVWKAKHGRAELSLIFECDSLDAIEESLDEFDVQVRLMLKGKEHMPGLHPSALLPYISIRVEISELFVLLNGLLATRLADRKRLVRVWRMARKMKKAVAQSP